MPDRTTPGSSRESGEGWRSELLQRFAWLLCTFGAPFVAYVFTFAPGPFAKGIGPLEAVALSLIPVTAAGVALTGGRSLALRGTALVAVLLFLGAVGVRYWGPTPGVFLSSLSGTVLATLLFGRTAGSATLAVSGVALLVLGSLGRTETTPAWSADLLTEASWIRITFVYAVLTGSLQLLVSGALKRLEASLRETRAALDESVREREARLAAEQVSLENVERLRQALDAAGIGTWEWDVATGTVVWTGHAEALLGVRPGTPGTIATFRDTVHPDDRAGVESRIAAALAGPGDEFAEEHRSRDEPARWLQGRGRVYRDQDGRPLLMRGTVQDVTAQRNAEQTIRESEAELRALFSAMSDVIFVIDEEGRYLRVAPSGAELLFRPAAELVGRRLHEVFPASEADGYLARIRECLASGRTVHFEYCMTIDGAARWFAAATSPLLEDRAVWVARDVTDRHRAEEKLRASEQRWRRISEATFEGIGFSENGVIVDVNAQLGEILGGTAEELVGRRVVDCVAPEDRERVAAAMRRESSGAYEHRALRKDGTTVLVETRARSLAFEGRQLRVTAVRDVSERARLEAELRRRERLAAIGALVGGVAHEVRTPLFSISATLDALEAGSGDSEAEQELKALLRSQVSRLSNLMQDLLDYSRPPRLRLATFSPADAVRRAASHCQRLAEQSDVRILSEVPAHLPEVTLRPRPDRAGAREPDRERRPALSAGGDRCRLGGAVGRAARRCPSARRGRRARHSRIGPRAGVRALLQQEKGRNGPGARDRAALRRGARRHDQRGKPNRRSRRDVHCLPARLPANRLARCLTVCWSSTTSRPSAGRSSCSSSARATRC